MTNIISLGSWYCVIGARRLLTWCLRVNKIVARAIGHVAFRLVSESCYSNGRDAMMAYTLR